MVERACTLWQEIEAESGAELLVESGLLLSGKPKSGLIQGLVTRYRVRELPLERRAAL